METLESTLFMLMKKNPETGFLENEVGSYKIDKNSELIQNMYLTEEEGKEFIHLTLSTGKDVDDWQFSAILDYYDIDILKSSVISISEIEDSYNPTWEIVFEFEEDNFEETISLILEKHSNELIEVFEEIKDKKEEYTDL